MSSLSPSEWDLEAFQPRQSLWKLVEEFAPESERREIKEILGEDIIDETVDLHREVCALLEIWQDYRDENDKRNKELSLNSHFQRLPEPPEMRSNLKKEIQLFVKALRQRSVENGSIELSLSKKEMGIVDYAFNETTGSKKKALTRNRPRTAGSLEDGRCTPCRPTSSGSGSRSSSSLSDVMESFQDQLNFEGVDEVAERLRNILLEEKDFLLEDIAFLQNSLFEESHFRENLQVNCKPEPSLQELKELGIKLEKEMTCKGTMPSSFRKPSHSPPSRRPKIKRNVVRSLSTPKPNTAKEQRSGVSVRAPSSNPQSLPSSPSRSGSDSLSPSPPTSAIQRRPGSASRFRKMVFDSRLDES